MGKKTGMHEGPSTRSLILDFRLQETQAGQVEKPDVAKLGGTLLKRAESIYAQTKWARTLAGNAYDNPARLLCSGISFAAGASRIWSGDVITGGIAVGFSAKEIYNQCTSGNNLTLQRLLNDIDADVDMVRSLEEGQQKSYGVIDENLNLIRRDVETLYNKLDEIKNLNTEGLISLDGAKKQAFEKGLAAKAAYCEALELFSGVKKTFGISKEIYQKCATQFDLIKQIAREQDEEVPLIEKLDSLVNIAEEASTGCMRGKEHLDNADETFNLAMAALARASSLKDEAIEAISKTVQSAQDTLKAGLEKVEYTAECKERIEATQKELKDVKKCSKYIMRLLDEMSEEIKKAKVEVAKKLDPSDVFVAVGVGVVAAPLGTLSAVALGVTSAYTWHNGTTIADTTKKVYNYLFGAPQPLVAAVAQEEVFRVKFQETSSGYYGWVKGRGSNTVGTVDINLGGDEVKQVSFDLNNPQYPISKEDLFSLYSRMITKLENKTLDPAYCRTIIKRLQMEVLPRGAHRPDVVGLISEKQAAYGLVKAMLKYADKL